MSTHAAPRATAQGTLAKTPFAHLTQFILSRELSGTLALWPDAQGPEAGVGQDRVWFDRGIFVAMRSREPATDLLQGLLPLFARRHAPYAFYEQQDLLGRPEGVLRGSVDPYYVLSQGVRAHAAEVHVREVLQKLGERPVRLRVGFPVGRLGLDPWEVAVVEALREQPMTVTQAVARCHEPEDAARRLFYLLTLIKGFESAEASTRGASVRPPAQPASPPPPSGTRSSTRQHPASPPSGHASRPPLRVDTGSRPRVSSPPPASIPPPQDAPFPEKPAELDADEAALWDEVIGRFSELDHQTHFELLGVSHKASTSEVTTAYFGMVKRLHPDRIPPSLAPLAVHIRQLFERVTEAHDVLTNEDKRLAYVRAVSEGGGTRASERMMAAVLQSAMDMQKAEVLLRRRKYDEALVLVEQAIETNPDEQANYGVRGWLRHLLHSGPDAPLEEIAADIDRTLADNDQNAKAHYYKGVVLKRLGEPTQALPHFRKASALDPRHIEAEREVRLAEIRKQSQGPGKKAGGLWRKLFSKNEGSR